MYESELKKLSETGVLSKATIEKIQTHQDRILLMRILKVIAKTGTALTDEVVNTLTSHPALKDLDKALRLADWVDAPKKDIQAIIHHPNPDKLSIALEAADETEMLLEFVSEIIAYPNLPALITDFAALKQSEQEFSAADKIFAGCRTPLMLTLLGIEPSPENLAGISEIALGLLMSAGIALSADNDHAIREHPYPFPAIKALIAIHQAGIPLSEKSTATIIAHLSSLKLMHNLEYSAIALLSPLWLAQSFKFTHRMRPVTPEDQEKILACPQPHPLARILRLTSQFGVPIATAEVIERQDLQRLALKLNLADQKDDLSTSYIQAALSQPHLPTESQFLPFLYEPPLLASSHPSETTQQQAPQSSIRITLNDARIKQIIQQTDTALLIELIDELNKVEVLLVDDKKVTTVLNDFLPLLLLDLISAEWIEALQAKISTIFAETDPLLLHRLCEPTLLGKILRFADQLDSLTIQVQNAFHDHLPTPCAVTFKECFEANIVPNDTRLIGLKTAALLKRLRKENSIDNKHNLYQDDLSRLRLSGVILSAENNTLIQQHPYPFPAIQALIQLHKINLPLPDEFTAMIIGHEQPRWVAKILQLTHQAEPLTSEMLYILMHHKDIDLLLRILEVAHRESLLTGNVVAILHYHDLQELYEKLKIVIQEESKPLQAPPLTGKKSHPRKPLATEKKPYSHPKTLLSLELMGIKLSSKQQATIAMLSRNKLSDIINIFKLLQIHHMDLPAATLSHIIQHQHLHSLAKACQLLYSHQSTLQISAIDRPALLTESSSYFHKNFMLILAVPHPTLLAETLIQLTALSSQGIVLTEAELKILIQHPNPQWVLKVFTLIKQHKLPLSEIHQNLLLAHENPLMITTLLVTLSEKGITLSNEMTARFIQHLAARSVAASLSIVHDRVTLTAELTKAILDHPTPWHLETACKAVKQVGLLAEHLPTLLKLEPKDLQALRDTQDLPTTLSKMKENPNGLTMRPLTERAVTVFLEATRVNVANTQNAARNPPHL